MMIKQAGGIKGENYFLNELQVHGGITESIARIAPGPVIDFSSNLNPFGPPEGLKEALSTANIEHYPAGYSSVEDSLSRFVGCQPENLLITNGASEAFYFLSLFYAPEIIALQIPSFSEYRNSAQALSAVINEIKCDPSSGFNLKEHSEALKSAGLLFVGNPNNPDGRLLETAALAKIIKQAEEFETIVILDEAFIDFCGRSQFSMAGSIEKHSNLIIVGSLTKVYAIAGLRFGYIAANARLISGLKKARPPWPVSSATSMAVEFCLKDTAYYRNTISKIDLYKEEFVSGLSEAGVKVFPSKANYLLCRLPDNSNSGKVTAKLLKKGFLIRDCRSFGLEDKYIRLAVKLPEQNKLLVQALADVLTEGKAVNCSDAYV